MKASSATDGCRDRRVVSGLGRGHDKKDDPSRKDLDKIQGRWDYVSVKRNGKEFTADQLKGRYSEYKGDKFTVSQDGKAVQTSTFKLDPAKTPGQIDLMNDGPGEQPTVKGIYKIEGDTLTICWAIPAAGKDRPTEFKPAAGLNLQVFKKAK